LASYSFLCLDYGWLKERHSALDLRLEPGALFDALSPAAGPDPQIAREMRRDRVNPAAFRCVNGGRMAIAGPYRW
jgi:hypothetical protein